MPVDASNNEIPKGSDGAPQTKPAAFRMVDGVLGGRVAASQLVAAAGGLSKGHDPDGGNEWFCNDGLFSQLRSLVCGGADISSRSGTTSTPPIATRSR